MSKPCKIMFAVEGDGPLPLDMLRCDRCYPFTEEDSIIAHKVDIHRVVLLVHHASDRHWQPTRERWQSSGWKVIEVDVVRNWS